MQLKEEAVFTLKFDGKPVINELGELEQRLKDVREAQQSVEKGTKEWAENKAAIKELEAQIKQVREEMGVSGMTVQQLQGYYRQLNSEIQKLTPGTEEYKKKAADLQEVNAALTTHRQTIRGVGDEVEKQPSLWERAKAGVMVFFAAFGATELLQRAFSFVQDGIQKALALSDMMGGVSKATGQSAEEVQALAKELDKIDTRTTKESLMDIAQIGGQLGVANEELLGFIKSTDMAAVALGDEFSGGAEEAASKLGSLKKLFGQTDELSYGDAINKIGSAINELGADGSATGPVIADFTARMGQLGDLSPQITQTMGLGAAFQELGLSAEISAGGLTNILKTAAVATDEFANYLGKSEQYVKNLINTNPNGFLLELAQRMKGLPTDQVEKDLKALGITSQEAGKVMALLKDQTELVTQKQELANKAFSEGTSLQKEFNTMNSTAAAEYEKSQKSLALIATEIGQGLLPAITKGSQGLVAFVNIIRAIPEFVSENRTSFAALGLAILAFNGHLIAATASSIAHAAAEKARVVWTQSATTAQWLLNTAMDANPIGVVIAAIALLVAGFTALYNNSSTVRGIINGLWEVMKTGVSLIGDLTDKVVGWLKIGLEPLKPVLDITISVLKGLWDVVQAGLGYWNQLSGAVSNFVNGSLSRISTALEPVRSALSSFWGMLDTAATKIKNVGSAITSFLHVDELVGKVKSAAGQIGDAFNKGYGDKLESERPKQLVAHQQHLDKKKSAEQTAANQMTDFVSLADQKALDKKAAQADKHRQSEATKAQKAAQKEADEKVKADADANKKVAEMNVNAIKDELERDKAKLQLKYQNELANINQSKASQQVKATWEKALADQLQRDIAKTEEDHRKKKEKDETETAKRILDLKIKLSGDEKADKLQKLEDVASATRAQIQKDITDETQKASMLKQVNDNLIRDKEAVEQQFRQKKQAEETALQNSLYQATVADAQNRLMLAGTNAQAIYDAKKMRLDAEYQHNRQKLQQEAADEKARNDASIQDTDRRAQQNKAIDDRLKAQLKASDTQYETEKTQLTQEKNEARRQNHQQYVDAIKQLMDGDFKSFTDFLTKKLTGEKKNLTERQQAQVDAIDRVGEYTVMAVQALQKLSQMKLDKELANIKKEKDSQLNAWKEKYDKGLINKDEYEKGVDKINKEADSKTKQAQLEAFKRQQKIDIAMAVINGAQAALKSLAMLGWPLGLIAVAGAVATTAIQIAMIKNQQPPSLAKGGKIQNAGVPEGPRHGSRYGDSGLSITRRDTGEEVAEMEGGEPIMVLSRNTYQNNRKVVDSLLHSSLHRNGAPIMRQGGLFSDGGTYGDYLSRGGLRQYAEGGWMDDINNQDEGNSSGGGYTSTYSGSSSEESSGGEANNAELQAQIDKSQKVQEDIAKATADTALAVDKISTLLTTMQYQYQSDTYARQSALASQLEDVKTTIKEQIASLSLANGLQLMSLRTMIHNDLLTLQSTLKVEMPSMSKEFGEELASLRTSLGLWIALLRTGIHQDFVSLEQSSTKNFDTLGKTIHQDNTDLGKQLHTDLTAFQKSNHADMAELTDTMVLELDELQLNVHKDFEGMAIQNTLLQSALRTELKNQSTNIQATLKAQLEALLKSNHDDVVWLHNMTKDELRGVQYILSGTKNEQAYQSTLLRIISEKNLTVSVQNVVNVQNQIDIVADKSDFK